MATLVFTAIGTALGGPVGGAIGSLLGQSFDQQLFGSSRRGPRLGDLAVQTSTYGTQVPRIYGAMRVAGSVIWATDLQESSTQTGAKGQPDTTVYSYSVSFAVALSSRVAGQVKRIWADGKLLRGAAGDFKVSTGFRYHDGSEDEAVDPLIGSIEGIAQTPAYRGLALAVFENLELAEYGNRIPFLTFEIEADPAPPTISSILSDASQAQIRCESPVTVGGYAAHGPNIRSALAPLIEHFGLDLFDDGVALRSPPNEPAFEATESELGSGAGAGQPIRIERTQLSARSLPSVLTLSYYDASRDYQASQMRGSVGEGAGREDYAELSAVIEASAAKALVETELARTWSRRDRLKLRLPPSYMKLKPGSTVTLSSSPLSWVVEQATIEAFAVVAELRPVTQGLTSIVGDAGRAVNSHDLVAGATSLALLEIPDEESDQSDGAAIYLAASSPAGRWRSVPVEVAVDGVIGTIRTSARKAVLGSAVTALAPPSDFPLDQSSAVEVELVDQDQWLESCDDRALAQGANFAILGSELFHFAVAEPLGFGRFRLSRLVRGRRGTEWAMESHAAGEAFTMIEPHALHRLDLPTSIQGSEIRVRARGLADADSPAIYKRLSRRHRSLPR